MYLFGIILINTKVMNLKKEKVDIYYAKALGVLGVDVPAMDVGSPSKDWKLVLCKIGSEMERLILGNDCKIFSTLASTCGKRGRYFRS